MVQDSHSWWYACPLSFPLACSLPAFIILIIMILLNTIAAVSCWRDAQQEPCCTYGTFPVLFSVGMHGTLFWCQLSSNFQLISSWHEAAFSSSDLFRSDFTITVNLSTCQVLSNFQFWNHLRLTERLPREYKVSTSLPNLPLKLHSPGAFVKNKEINSSITELTQVYTWFRSPHRWPFFFSSLSHLGSNPEYPIAFWPCLWLPVTVFVLLFMVLTMWRTTALLRNILQCEFVRQAVVTAFLKRDG